MPYTRPYSGGFQDYPNTASPINALALNTMDLGIKAANDQVQSVTTIQRAALSPTIGQMVWDSDLKQFMTYINANGGNAWQGFGNIIICTSTTRPLTPFHGQRIYETDTKCDVIYNGSAWVCITPKSAVVATSQTTASLTYVDLTTAGASVSCVTGTSAIVTVCAQITNSAAATNYASYAVSGATTIAAADAIAAIVVASAANVPNLSASTTQIITGLTAGTNTFTMKYRVTAGTGTFVNRSITVQALA